MVAKIYFLHRPQSDRNSIWPVRPVISVPRVLPDDADALAIGLSRPGTAGDRQMAATHFRPGLHAGWENDARLLQFVRRDAWHDHDFRRRRAAGLCSVRQFRRAAANRCTRHDISQGQCGEFLGLWSRRRDYVDQFLRAGWNSQERLDVLYAVGRHLRYGSRPQSPIQWADSLVDRIYFSDLVIAAWRRQFHHYHHSTARQGTDLDAAAVFRLGPVCYRISVAAGISAARSGNRYAVNGSGRAHQLLLAGRLGREWCAGIYQRRRQPAFVATFVLVLGPPGGLRADFACVWDCCRNSGQQFAQTALGL